MTKSASPSFAHEHVRAASCSVQTGTLFLIKDSGYGFIRSNRDGVEYFCTLKQFSDRRDWVVGRDVEFTPGPTPFGRQAPKALNIRAIPREDNDA